jgi:hypothetical protein
MPWVYDHVMRLHGVLNFVYDCSPGRFDAEHLSNLDDMVGGSLFSNHTWNNYQA